MTRVLRSAVCAAFLVSAGPVALTTPAWAAEPAPVTTKATVTARGSACADRFLGAMNMNGMLNAVSDSTVASIRKVVPAASGADKDARAEAVAARARKTTIEDVMPKMMADMKPGMLEIFTEAELCGMADFYTTETGRSIIQKMPQMMNINMASTHKFAPEMETRIIAVMCAEFDCKGTPLEKVKPAAS